MDRDEAIYLGLTALKAKFEGIMNNKNIEIGYIDTTE